MRKMNNQDSRYKVMYYLSPETNVADQCAMQSLTAAPHGERAKLQRAAMLAGLAMHRVDPRIPYLLSELLTADTGPEEILQVINAALSRGSLSAWRKEPVQDSLPVPASATAEAAAPAADDATRANAKGLFGKA